MLLSTLFLFLTSTFLFVFAKGPLPVVIWHGIGDTCCLSFSMGYIKKTLEHALPGVTVISIRIGDDEKSDMYNSFFYDVNKMIDEVCQQLANDKTIQEAGAYNAVGFSQGGQFFRAVAQRCPSPRMNNLITFASQHQGVFGLPKCPGVEVKLCDYARVLLDMGAYLPFVQNSLVPAQYWHDPLNEKLYFENSQFLADINQEREFKPEYKENLLKVKQFVMVKFLRDTMVQPIESEWFGFYVSGQDTTVYNYTMSDIYKQDKLGLRQMDKEGRLHFYKIDDDHLRMSDEFFIKTIINNYLV